MKLFGNSPVSRPQVILGVIVATYSSKGEAWKFEYENVEHISYGNVLHLFNNSALEIIQGDILALMPEMKERLEFGWKIGTK